MKVWMPKATFGSGELSPTMARRSDTRQHQDGAALMRNVRLLNTGGFSRRPGTRHMLTVPAGGRLIEFTFNVDQEYLLVFSNGRMDAYRWSGGSLAAAGSLTSCPWSAADVAAMTWVQSGDTVFLACRGWAPQTVQRTGASSWTRAAWTPDPGPGGSAQQPYYKFADPESTITPSARSGSITVTASASVFSSAHVGQRLRYVQREIAITAVASGTSASATVVEELPKTQRLTVESVAGFQTREQVEQDVTGAKGEVVAIGASTIDVLITQKGSAFEVDEDLAGPNAKSNVTVVADIDPAPARDWDEPYLSPVHGYPGAVGLHRDRLWWSGHTALPASVLASRVGTYFNFDLGTGEDADGIFENIGDAAVAWVRHLASAETLLVLTDQGAYYVPESPANPIRPSSIQFARVGAHGAGQARPQAFDEGLLYVHRSGNAVMDLRATGDTVKQWSADDVGLLAAHLIQSPTDAAATHGADGAPERYAFFVGADDTLAVLHSIQSQEVLGWTRWDTDGAFRSVAALGGTVFVVVERTFGAGRSWCLERFDESVTLDGVAELATEGAAAPLYAGMDVWARAGRESWGPLSMDGNGRLTETIGVDGALEVGRHFRPLVRTLSPEPQRPNGTSAGTVKRITKARVYVLSSTRVALNGRTMTAHDIGEDVTAAPVARTDWHEVTLLGRQREPYVEITQDDPVPMTVLGLSMEVVV